MSHQPKKPRDSDGEKGNLKGDIFNSHNLFLLKQLGYKEIVSGRYGVDLIAEPPQQLASSQRPLFSPNGVTAFEFTTEFKITESNIDELKEKIEKKIPKKILVKGGVLVCDTRIPDELYKYGLKNKIFLWDFRDVTFLATKNFIGKMWSLSGTVLEKKLTSNSTYLWVLERNPIGIFRKSRVAIFFHNPIIDIDSQALDKNIEHLSENIIEESGRLGILPIQVELEIHARGFLRKDSYSKIDLILKKFSNEEKIAFIRTGLITFYVGSWIGITIQDIPKP